MNNFLKRTLSGFAYVLVILLSVIIHPFIFFPAFMLIHYFLLREFYKLTAAEEYSSGPLPAVIAGTLFFSLMYLVASGWLEKIYLVFVIPLLLILFIPEIFRKPKNPVNILSVAAFGFLYISLPLGILNFLVFPGIFIPALLPNGRNFYPWILTGIFVVVWMYDTGAYLSGSWAGSHLILKRISPGKTWEGVIGGGIISAVSSLIVAVVLQNPGMKFWLGVALIVVVFGTLGDLFESMLKRTMHVKDSGKAIPGHGGLLDRFDSLLFVIPVVFLWLIITGNH